MDCKVAPVAHLFKRAHQFTDMLINNNNQPSKTQAAHAIRGFIKSLKRG